MENIKLIQRISIELEKLGLLSESYKLDNFSMQEMEIGILQQLVQTGKALIEDIIQSKTEDLKGFTPKTKEGELLRGKGMKDRKYLSIFGLIEFSRPMHWSKEKGSYFELDKRLELPEKLWSYNLQEWVGESAAENDFKESVSPFNKVLGINLSAMSSKRNGENLGELVDVYYENKEIEVDKSLEHFSVSFDGKGVPKIVEEVKKKGNPKKRLGKGEKRGTKQMATVVVASSFEPKNRTKESILRSLMGVSSVQKRVVQEGEKLAQENDNRWHKNIHRRAFLADQDKAIEYGVDCIAQRMTTDNCRFVVPIDAGIGLETKVLSYVKERGLEEKFDGIIIDIIHVAEYVWNVANAIFGENSEIRASWVRKMLSDLLESKTEQVTQDLKRIRDKGVLTESQRKQVIKTITYFSNNGHNMDYKKFIEKGYPVSSALVESACGHLVKERAEGTGMRWSSKGIQNILDLRAVKQNNDMADFMKFVVKERQARYSNNVA